MNILLILITVNHGSVFRLHHVTYGYCTYLNHFVALLQDNKDARHVKTYEVALKDKDFIEGPWSQNNLDNGADLLIPVPPPLCGVLIIGEETIVYCSASAFKAIPIRPVSFCADII